MDRQQLVAMIRRLESELANKKPKKADFHNSRQFDFEKHNRCRHVAFKLSYIGDKYHGFAHAPDDTVPTVESQIFDALLKTKLVPSIDRCGWSRCGRTDKGVSAFGQVVSLWVRTNKEWNGVDVVSWNEVSSHKNMRQGDKPACGDEDLPYLAMLNNVLPDDIRILAWAAAPSDFDARFSCVYRKYNYFFDARNLDLQAMNEAAQMFVGTHDCRFICKIDPCKADRDSFFTRTIFESRIEALEHSDRIHVFVVKGQAFLWHQVRNMMALLLLVGQRKEKVTVVRDMLDISKHPDGAGRPDYAMAPDGPLVLVECGFPPESIQWQTSDSKGLISAVRVAELFDSMWVSAATRQCQLHTLITTYTEGLDISENTRGKKYTPVMDRHRCASIIQVREKNKRMKIE